MRRTFKGGVHPDAHKAPVCDQPIVDLAPPQELVYPMLQHIGAPCTPCVAVGDTVQMGQLIGEPNGEVSAGVHASVSGRVKAVEKRMHPNGMMIESVVVENDGADTLHSSVCPPKKAYTDMSAEEIRSAIRSAGIVGMGGAGFPTHVKLSPPSDARIEYVIVNGAECEPYLTSDHREMLENTADVIGGLKVIMQLFGLREGYIGIEDNKPDAIAAMQRFVAQESAVQIHVVPLRTKYPQGGEKQLIRAVTGRRVGPGQLPWQVGVIVNNVDTCAAIYRAVTGGRPLMHRIVTVGGDCVAQPMNLRVRLGTPFRVLFERTGAFVQTPRKLIMGGPMMGLAVPSLDVPVVKGTSGALAFGEAAAADLEELPCVKCAKCVYACPMRLLPNRLDACARTGQFEALEKLHISDCIECGSCAYICPSKRRQVQQIRVAKVKLRSRQAKAN